MGSVFDSIECTKMKSCTWKSQLQLNQQNEHGSSVITWTKISWKSSTNNAVEVKMFRAKLIHTDLLQIMFGSPNAHVRDQLSICDQIQASCKST